MLQVDCCPLCCGLVEFYFADKKRHYCRCLNCRLVFVPKQFHLGCDEEKSVYDLHENNVFDPQYRQFLSRIFQPMKARLPTHGKGLDFGCGPGPALAEMFRESGFLMNLYDLYYFSDASVLDEQYDFVVSTEVIEHLSDPMVVLDRIWQILKPGGLLGLMTKRVKDKAAFINWHYKNDPTHICFFHEDSFRHLEKKWGASLEIISNDVVIFKKRV